MPASHTDPRAPGTDAPRLVLASSSPRRRELLARIGVTPARIAAPAIDETPRAGEQPRAYVLRMAEEKARAVTPAPGELVLAGDTAVVAGRRILGQPADDDAQRAMLTLLAGRRHQVISAVALIAGDGTLRTRVVETIVRFRPLGAAEIDGYIATGEGRGKAGGYAIQGHAEAFVAWLAGSHSGVVGLPLAESRLLLRAAGYPVV